MSDYVDHFSRGDLRLDRIEEADEFLVPMALLLRPMTVPSRMLRAAKSVVVP